MDKVDIINQIAAKRHYRRYLEICTPSTGGKYAGIDRSVLECHRLMYLCPDDFDDGEKIDFKSGDRDISSFVGKIHEAKIKYDVILCDPYHEYETSRRDIEIALALLAPNGTIVVHDCLPTELAIAAPLYVSGSWCGVTYKAYVDIVTGGDDLGYYTIDTDYGCGVIQKADATSTNADAALVAQWKSLGSDYDATFHFLQRHKVALLGLISPEDFQRIKLTAF